MYSTTNMLSKKVTQKELLIDYKGLTALQSAIAPILKQTVKVQSNVIHMLIN